MCENHASIEDFAANADVPARNCAINIAASGASVPRSTVTVSGWTYSSNAVRDRAGALGGNAAQDPTRTKTLRNQYSGKFYKRLRALRGVIRTAIVEQDAFGLGEIRGPMAQNLDYALSGNQQTTFGQWFNSPGPRAFDFPSDPQKKQKFMDWLDEQVQRGLLERVDNPAVGVSGASSEWQNTYVRRAYAKGVEHAQANAAQQGVNVPDQELEAVFRAPRHAQTLGMVYSRAYSELDGITSRMGQQIGRVLADGLRDGENPRTIARTINSVVGIPGTSNAAGGMSALQRSRMLARTEVIRSYNEGALNRYADLGVSGVTAQVEFATAGDSRVCPICQGLDGKTFKIEDARGVIPVHPNCRCTWIPVV